LRSELKVKGVAGDFSVNGVPSAFLLDTDGKVVWYGHPVVDKPSLPERIEEITFPQPLARSASRRLVIVVLRALSREWSLGFGWIPGRTQTM
jgi:hypothetical protein